MDGSPFLNDAVIKVDQLILRTISTTASIRNIGRSREYSFAYQENAERQTHHRIIILGTNLCNTQKC